MKKWGLRGPIATVVLGGFCVAAGSVYQSKSGYLTGGNLPGALLATALCPLNAAWVTLISMLDIQGDTQRAFIIPMIATAILYLAAGGFCVGALVGKLFERRGE